MEQVGGNDKLSKIHSYLVETYEGTPKELDRFKRLMQDEAYASKIHSQLVSDEDVEITKDYNAFADSYGLKKKAVSTTSATSAKPTISQPKPASQASGAEPVQQAKATSQPIVQEPTKDPLALIRSGLSKRFKDPNGLTNATEADLKRYASRHIEDLRDKKESPLTADELDAILSYALPKNQSGAKELLEKEIARKRAASETPPTTQQPKPLFYDPEKARIEANQRSEQLQTNPEIKKKEREQLLSTAIDAPEKLKRYQLKEAEAFLDENKDKEPYYATKKEKIKKALGDTGQSQGSDLANRFFKGILQIVPDASNTVAIMAKAIDKNVLGVDKPLTDYQTRQWGIAAQELIDKNLVTNQYFDEDELSTLSNGLGQVASTVGLALLTRGSSAEAQALRTSAKTLPELAVAATKNTAGLRTATKEILRREAPEVAGKVFSEQSLTKTAVDLLGKSTKQIALEAAAGVPAKLFNPASLATGSTVFASTFKEATDAGADFDTAFKVSAKNAGLTTTLAILPMEAILKSAEGIGKISLKEYTKNAIKAAGTEGLTEGFEQYYANLNAQETYDLNRKLMDGVLLNAKAGGVIGGFMSAFLGIRNLSLKKANETNDPRLKEQAAEFDKLLPKDLTDGITPREEVSVSNTGSQRGREKPELMPNVPVPTQQVLGNNPQPQQPTIDVTTQPVELAPIEKAEELLASADASGNGTTMVQVGQIADAVEAATTPATPTSVTPPTEATPTPEPITLTPEQQLGTDQPDFEGNKDAPTLEGIYVTPKSNAQLLYVSTKGNNALYKQPDGSLTVQGSRSANDLLLEAAENEPEMFDNGDRVDIDENLSSEQELFDTLLGSNNPLDIADAFMVGESIGATDVEGSRQQVLADLALSLTPQEIEQQTGNSASEFSNLFPRIRGNKADTPIDVRVQEYEDMGITVDEVFEMLDMLDKDPNSKETIKNLQQGIYNNRTAEAARKFKELTGANLTPELAQKIAGSNPLRERFVQGVDEEGNLIKTPIRDAVFKPEVAPETDKYAGFTKREAEKAKRKDKITQRAEEFAQGKVDAYKAETQKSDIQSALDRVKQLLQEGKLTEKGTLNSGGGIPILTKEGDAAIRQLIKAIVDTGISNIKKVAQELYDTLPDDIKSGTIATDWEDYVAKALERTDETLKEATDALIKLFKQITPANSYTNTDIVNFVNEKLGATDLATKKKTEKFVGENLAPKKKSTFDPTLKGARKTTKQVLGIPLNPVLKKLIDIGKVIVDYVSYGREKGFADAQTFIESSTMEDILQYLDTQINDEKYSYVAKVMEDYILDLMALSNSREEILGLEEVYARIFNNRKEKISQAARTLETGKLFKEAIDSPQQIEIAKIRLANAQSLKEKLTDNAEKKKITDLQGELAASLAQQQKQTEAERQEAVNKAILEQIQAKNRKLAFELGQSKQREEALRKTTPQSIDEAVAEYNKLTKELAKKGKPDAQTQASRTARDKVKSQVEVRKQAAKAIADLTFKEWFDFNQVQSIGNIPLSDKAKQRIKEYVKATAKELGYRVQAIAESVYNLLPQEVKDRTTIQDWERIVANIQGEDYQETIGAGVDALDERIDRDIQERILKGQQKPKDAVEDVLAELYKIYREKTIASDRVPIQPKSANELIAELLSQGEQASSVWTEVQNRIYTRYGADADIMEALAEYLNETPLQLPVSKKKIKQAVREYFKGKNATIEQLIRDRVDIEKETGANTRQAIIALMPDLPIDIVNGITNAIGNEGKLQAEDAANRILDRYFDDTVTTEKKPKPIKQRILSDIALAKYADRNRVIAGINRKYGTDIQTIEELADLETALDAANTSAEVSSALKDFARWTPEGAKLAGRVTKTEAQRIGETEDSTGLDPVALTLKALHDVAKQNKEVEAKTKKDPTNVIDTMRAVLGMQNTGEAATIWETAKQIVNRQLEDKYGNDPAKLAEAKQQIQEYFGQTPLQMAIPKKDFDKAVRQKLKEVLGDKTVAQAIAEFNDVREQVNVSVMEMLTKGFDLDPAFAEELANLVEETNNKIWKKAAEQVAKRYEKPLGKKRADRVPLAIRIAQLISLGKYGNEDVNRLVEERYGIALTDTELAALDIAANEAAKAYKEGGATSSAYKAAAQKFDKELSKVTKGNFWDIANTITNANLLSGPVGRIADVISNTTLTLIELLKAGAEFPVTLNKSDWNKYKAKLRFAQTVTQGVKQGAKVANLQLKGKITDINRYDVGSARNIEAMIEQTTGIPRAYLRAGKWVYRIMAATDSLLTSEIAYQKALFDLLVSTNTDKSLTAQELAKQAFDAMYGNEAKVNNAATTAYFQTFGQYPKGTTQAEIDKEAQTATGGDKDIYKTRKIEILQEGIDENIRTEARRVANIQAYKGEQFGSLGLASDRLNQATKNIFILQGLTRFSGTAFKIMNVMADYSLYGFARAAGFSLGYTFAKPAFEATNGRVLANRTVVYDPEGKLDPDTKKAIEKLYRRQQLGRAIIGTALGSLVPAIFASLGDEDDPRENYFDVIGNMDAYPRTYRELLKQAGVKPNSLKIGNVYISFEYILPLALNFAITANGKDMQRAARKLKEMYPDRYKDVTDESINTFYEYALLQYTNPSAIASSINSVISQSPIRGLSEGITTAKDITKTEAEIDDLAIEATKGMYKHISNAVIPKIVADFEKYMAIGLDKAGVTDVGAMAMNNDKGFWVSIAYMSSLGDVTTAFGWTDPKRKIDAFGNIYEKEPNEYRMPVKVFERKFATEPIIQLQIESGVIKMPAKSAKYITAKKGKDVTEMELTEREVYDMNLEAGKEAKAQYTPAYIQEDMALLKTDRAKAVERIKKTSSAVLEYARLKYIYNKFVKGNSAIPASVQRYQLTEIYKAEAKIKKARK